MEKKEKNQPKAPASFLFWLSFAQLVSWGGTFYLFGLLLGPIEGALGISRGQSSLAIGLTILCEGLVAYPIGRWIDRGYGRVVMTLGSILASLWIAMLSFTTSLWSFYLLWALLGGAMGCVLYSPLFSITTRRYPFDYRRAIIVITFLGGLASTVFIPLTAWLFARFGWQTSLWVLAGLNLLICAPIHFLGLHGEQHGSTRQSPSERINSPRENLGQRLRMGLEPEQWRRFVYIGLFSTLALSITAAVASHLIQILRERGLPEAWVVTIPACIGVVQVIGRALILLADKYLNIHQVNLATVALMPVSLLLLIVAGHSIVGLLVFAFVFGLANGGVTIVKGTALATYVSQTNIAALNGRLGLPTAIARASLPPLVGWIWSPANGYHFALWLMLLVSLGGFFSFALAQRRKA